MGSDQQIDRPEIDVRGQEPVVAAVVGGIHGDEPSGVRAVEGILGDEAAGTFTLTAGVRFIIGNPSAVAAGQRYLECDLNRSFPGDPDGLLEERLASVICEAVADVPTLALHATRSSGTPFAFARQDDEAAIELVRSMSVPYLVLVDGEGIGSLSTCGSVVTVEAGLQGSENAAQTARELTEEFLIASGAMDGSASPSDPAVFESGEPIERPTGTHFEVLVDNFDRVEAGDPYVRVDGTDLTADETFYPILLSADGYEDILGFKGDKLADSISEFLG